MKYEINELCIIDRNNPTTSKDYVEIAINIIPKNKNNKFENFLLAIEDGQCCCEYFGSLNTFNELGEYFVYSIETDIDIEEKELVKLDEDFEYGFGSGGYYAVKINTDKGDYIAMVFNDHNGYYSHTIYYSNDELKIDVVEEDWL
ncbi:hypothetical protein GUI37_06075 [Helcococcus kunzii]|uniref:DUF7448 domain-containing protein n=1 Tax=Helcococcus kunzii TaxID=40091 RepID=UPI001BB037D2|nr:hypothetical protein [Helcococcus kunzii]QUY65107.1 hypothetical protein GUI37_06075 [Helcococcus kunzii]